MNVGFCYAAESSQFIKFGFSDDPVIRVSGLSTQIGEPVRLLGYVPGSRTQEARLHELMRSHVSHGEWYHKTDAVRRVAGLFPKRKSVPQATRDLYREIRQGTDRDAASRLIRACLEPGQSMLKQLPAIAAEIGISPRRARAIFNKEARLITKRETEDLRSLAMRKYPAFDRERA